MCGLIYVQSERQAARKSAWKRYLRQKTRGIDGFGFVPINNEVALAPVRATTEQEIKPKLMSFFGDKVLFHHRKPTSGDNHIEMTHPIHVSNSLLGSDYYFIHNGVIRNAAARKKEHESLGFEYTTELESTVIKSFKKTKRKIKVEQTVVEFVDSESLAIDFALWNEGLSDETDELESFGDIAFIALEVEKDTNTILRLHYGHNSKRSLGVEDRYDSGFFAITSEGASDLPENVVFTLDYATDSITQRKCRIKETYYAGATNVYSNNSGNICYICDKKIVGTTMYKGAKTYCMTHYHSAADPTPHGSGGGHSSTPTTTNYAAQNLLDSYTECVSCHQSTGYTDSTPANNGGRICFNCSYAEARSFQDDRLDEQVSEFLNERLGVAANDTDDNDDIFGDEVDSETMAGCSNEQYLVLLKERKKKVTSDIGDLESQVIDATAEINMMAKSMGFGTEIQQTGDELARLKRRLGSKQHLIKKIDHEIKNTTKLINADLDAHDGGLYRFK